MSCGIAEIQAPLCSVRISKHFEVLDMEGDRGIMLFANITRIIKSRRMR
jgi:hypothetical protein